ncbi:MAG: hypothetical protein ACYC6G_11935 [Desulfobaccales bacterium]
MEVLEMVKGHAWSANLAIKTITFLTCLGIVSGISGRTFGQADWKQRPRDLNLRARIESPLSGDQVKRHFSVQGTVTAGRTRNLWLIERVGQQHWPKEPKLIVREGRWEGEVFEGGRPPAGRLEILLVDVPDNLSQKFEEWLQTGHRTGHYPGIPSRDLRDMTLLDSKEYYLKTE